MTEPHEPTDAEPIADDSDAALEAAPAIDLDDLLHPEEQRTFRRLCMPTSSVDLAELLDVVRMHLAHVKENATPSTDVESAERIATAFEALLDPSGGEGFADDERSLLRGAAEYFLLDADADDDLTDPLGFDDDARVLNSVLKRIGRAEFSIEL